MITLIPYIGKVVRISRYLKCWPGFKISCNVRSLKFNNSLDYLIAHQQVFPQFHNVSLFNPEIINFLSYVIFIVLL